ncbi:uncharacterized protein EI90DRAFT_3130644 [Cantharellus anzutake]|uniref:uncharacterized protein n=1 Tax=Cantharellus anzutake TaxID=1750568 RepID=UPI001906B9EC|nr:uncharacterized protein EI90DRAFT_3130644 [Cantharellus anzutake]KAF8322888.1 hypothetical protein EI90DRAFT_3130644 [Cantharellus anzutake]
MKLQWNLYRFRFRATNRSLQWISIPFLRLQEAYEMENDSVALCRCLVSVGSESYTVDLAWSLGNLGTSLADLGRHSEALPVIRENVEFWRKLVAVHRTYTMELAGAPQNTGVLLGGLAIHPASCTPDLAQALQNLKISLDKLGWHSEALPVIDESVTLWHKRLVAVNPTSYSPDLARSLGNLDTSLTNLGRHSEVLPVMKESVKLWRELVAVHPSSYTPDLAQALKWTLDEFGWYILRGSR